MHLGHVGALAGETVWLAKDTAAEFKIEDLNGRAIQSAKDCLGNLPVDVLLSPIAHRRKKILLMDMDATLVHGETLDEVASLHGVGDKVAEMTKQAMQGGVKDWTTSLKIRMGLMKGFPLTKLQDILRQTKLNAGGKTLIQTMKKNGALTAVASGGFSPFVEQAKELAGFDTYACNKWDVENDCLNGLVLDPIFDAEGKKKYLMHLAGQMNVALSDTLAVGDGSNDIPMLQTAGVGVAYYAKDKVKAQIQNQINYTDLTSLLYLQGFKEEDFIND